MEERFARLMQPFFGSDEPMWGNGHEFMPQTNLVETEDAIEVTVELPGVKPEDFHVELREGDLWITGKKEEEHEEKGKTFHRVERSFGEFRRVFNLPAAVNAEAIDAEFRDGVLKVMIPKREEVKPKTINVKTPK
jgi:HSP20 family protein